MDLKSLLLSIYQCNSNVLELSQSKQIVNTIVQMILISVQQDKSLLLNEIVDTLKQQLDISGSNTINNRDDYILFLFILLSEIVSLNQSSSPTTTKTPLFIIDICNRIVNHFIEQSSKSEEKIGQLDEKVSLLSRLVVSMSVVSGGEGESSVISSSLLDVILKDTTSSNTSDDDMTVGNRFLQRYSLNLLNELLQSKSTYQLLSTEFLDLVLNKKLFFNIKSHNSLIRSHSFNAIETIISSPSLQQQQQQQQSKWLEQLYNSILQQQSDVNERLKLFFRFHKLFISSLVPTVPTSKQSKQQQQQQQQQQQSKLQQQPIDTFNILSKSEFFDVLFISLIDTDNVPRKQSLHLLKTFISLPASCWQQLLPFNPKQWTLYFSIYEAFNETKSHLFRPVWSQLPRLISASTSFASVSDYRQSSFWILVLLHRGFTHINPNIRRRVIVDLLTGYSLDLAESISSASSSMQLSTLLSPLLRSIDTPDFVVQQHVIDSTQQLTPSALRKRELFDLLTTFLEKTMKLNSNNGSLFIDNILGLVVSSMNDTNGVIMMLEVLISLVKSKAMTFVIADPTMEKLRWLLETHPIHNAPSNIYLYQRVLMLLVEMEHPTNQSPIFKQHCVKILSLLPKSMVDEWNIELSTVLNKYDPEWIGQYLVEHLNQVESTSIDDYASLARLLRFIPKQSEQLASFKSMILSSITLDSLLLVGSIVKENPTFFQLGEIFSVDNIKTINNIFTNYISQQPEELQKIAIESNDGDNQLQYQFKKMEMLVDFIARQRSSFSELAQSCKDILQDANNTTGNAQSKRSFDIRQISLMLLIWQRCHAPESNKEISRSFLLQLLQLRVERGAGSTLTLPKLLEYRWLCILELLQVSVDCDDASDKEEIEEIETICQLVFEYALDTLDNATPNSLASIYDTLLLTVVRGNIVVTPEQAGDFERLELPVLTNDEEMTRLFQLAYRAFSDCSRKSIVVVSSFINLLFHPLYFHCPTTIPLVKEFLGKTLTEWGESARISCALLSHCCAIWSTHLETLDTFLDDIINLCLLTTEDTDQQLMVVESLPTTTTDTNDQQQQHSYKMASNHGYIVRWFVSQLNQTSQQNDSAVRFVQRLMLSLLELNIQGELSQREYSQQSKTNKQKCRLWRTLCSLTHVDRVYSSDPISIAHIGVVTEMMWRILEVKNHPNVRYLIQLFIVNILIRTGSPTTVTQLLVTKLNHSNYDYQIAASIIIISTSYLYHLLNQEHPNAEMIALLFKSIIPWSTDFHHAVRTCTQLAIHTIISRKYKILEQLNQNEILQSMYHYLDNNNLQKRLREKQSLFIQNDDPIKQSLPSNIFTANDVTSVIAQDDNEEDTGASGSSTENKEDEDDGSQGLALDESVIPMSLLDVAKRLIKDFQSQFQSRLHQQQSSTTTTTSNTTQQDGADIVSKSDDIEIEDFQKRIIPWEQSMASLEELVDNNNNNNSSSNSTNNNNNIRPPRQQMIIVGTFIENTPNVAGLIRTSEIFNAEEVAIPNIKLLNDPQFQRVSVAADKWVPITEVNRQNLTSYLKAKKAKGYSILGVEQTSQSKNLATFQFPQKCLLLLGQEQNGIPAEYLELVDYCIEIPQFGVTRSLNVHVSASIVIWEYSQQQLNSKQ
ncbi:tRNA/rRNA methyltransferase SpoU family protein [Heterostelium album PN500]|uniref:tRNA/rRNA methyltransferase SpoU family protein n=1 Tax=Heterostelium pallidum (strain ATCC 26659 / Pp 5 / PN500) TaxID=670386 RepID=D3AYP3_HETP5|nr:tRNA/rRNA methyltransferase SpoU family protein [Heterostelium album PN500]EFA86070.1 tRNA/rRNA methyltransferase SpoU family protein [Heterostelium album PN500]|eukprot:XP_020438176.1 tRNA/rRNA methyltransferase SpoU family protein [Heterostelium album PN500]